MFDPEFDEVEGGGEDECPSCGVIPAIDGPSDGCYDPSGCGADLRDFDDEEEFFEEDDDEVDELDFGS